MCIDNIPRPLLEGTCWSGSPLCLSYIGRLYGRGRGGGFSPIKNLVSDIVTSLTRSLTKPRLIFFRFTFLKRPNTIADLIDGAFHFHLQVAQCFQYIFIAFSTDDFAIHMSLGFDLFGLSVCSLNDLITLYKLSASIAGKVNCAIGFFLGLGNQPISLSQQLLGFFHFLWDGDTHLVYQIQHTVFINYDVMGEGKRTALV